MSRIATRTRGLLAPVLAGATWRERTISAIGALIGVALAALAAQAFLGTGAELPLLMAPIGASAVLLFALPASPLAQPWPIIGGNTCSALIGALVAQHVPHDALGGGIAVMVAILVMTLLRCLHPPAGGMALHAVVGSPAVQALGYGYALPVGFESAALVVVGLIFHRLLRHNYPHRASAMRGAAPRPDGLQPEDIDAALTELGETFDVTPEDLEALLASAERHARRRRADPPR